MNRIDSHNTVSTLPAFPDAEVLEPGYFTDGEVVDGEGTDGTVVSAWWCNAVQEELIKVIETAGIELNRTEMDQLFKAIQYHIQNHASVVGAKAAADAAAALAQAAKNQAESVSGVAFDALADANTAQQRADLAYDRADAAYDMAESAAQTAENIQSEFSGIQSSIGIVGNTATRALGQFITQPEAIDLNESYWAPDKLFLTNDESTGVPADLTFPVYLEVMTDDGLSSVTQNVWDTTGNRVYTRCAAMNLSDMDNPIITWSPWNSVAVPQVVKDVTVEVDPADQEPGKYLVITFETENGEEPVYISIDAFGGAYTAGNNGISVSSNNQIGLILDSANTNGLEIGENGLKLSFVEPFIQQLYFESSSAQRWGVPDNVTYGYISLLSTDATAVTLTMSKLDLTGTVTLSVGVANKVDISAFSLIAANYQLTMTGGTYAIISVALMRD
jgi:hypothetical protein